MTLKMVKVNTNQHSSQITLNIEQNISAARKSIPAEIFVRFSVNFNLKLCHALSTNVECFKGIAFNISDCRNYF